MSNDKSYKLLIAYCSLLITMSETIAKPVIVKELLESLQTEVQ